jgi:dUTP pyrophosphatase
LLCLKIKILNPKIGSYLPLPCYATVGSAGMDLRACIDEPLIIPANQVQLIPTGIAVYIADPSYAGILMPRSGLAHKHGIILGNSVGLIDSDYQGELFISCFNRGSASFTIEVGERIAQLVLVKIAQATVELVDDFVVTERAVGGFGHTGRV